MKRRIKKFLLLTALIPATALCLCSCSKDAEIPKADHYTSTEKETLPPYSSRIKPQEETEFENDYDYSPVIPPTKTADGYEITVAGGNGKDSVNGKSDSYKQRYTKPSSDGIIIE